jgi:hypothetical protein
MHKETGAEDATVSVVARLTVITSKQSATTAKPWKKSLDASRYQDDRESV